MLPLRCVSKKCNSLCLVIDCHYINSQIHAPKFSQEGIQSVADQIKNSDNVITIEEWFSSCWYKKGPSEVCGFLLERTFLCVASTGIWN